MKHLSLAFLFSLLGLLPAQADTLLNYIEMPIEARNLLTFSGQGLSFKTCEQCEVIRLTPASQVQFLEFGRPIDLKRATEVFVSKQSERVSIFYSRRERVYDKVTFGSTPEVWVDEITEQAD